MKGCEETRWCQLSFSLSLSHSYLKFFRCKPSQLTLEHNDSDPLNTFLISLIHVWVKIMWKFCVKVWNISVNSCSREQTATNRAKKIPVIKNVSICVFIHKHRGWVGELLELISRTNLELCVEKRLFCFESCCSFKAEAEIFQLFK